MFASACRIAAALAMLAVPVVAVAQVIPPSEQPGRERERFIEPPRPAGRVAREPAEYHRPRGGGQNPPVHRDIRMEVIEGGTHRESRHPGARAVGVARHTGPFVRWFRVCSKDINLRGNSP
jgi:hypothetical protein